MTTELQRWAQAEIAWPLAGCAGMTVLEIRDWVEEAKQLAPAGSGLPRGAHRLEAVRTLREMCYTALRPVPAHLAIGDDTMRAAEAILDTPVDELAAMFQMSDTVMGNWRRIAATVTAQ